ncbi:hypothetical protein GF373_06445, partial [bacterium]|nr:hypothetical protein [bacterium]
MNMRRTIVFFLLISLGFLTGLSTCLQAQVNNATAEIEIPEYEDTLYIFDLNKYLELKPNNIKWKYDVINMVSALQGLVNRDNPQLYILYVREGLSGYQDNVDYFWLSYLRGGDNILSKMNVVYLDTLEEVLRVFRHYFMALVLWDPNVPSTGNAALTISGADGFLPVRHDRSSESLYTQVVFGEAQLPSAERLSGKFPGVGRIADTEIESSGSAKTDAYLWANELYLSQGLCSPTYMANFLDPSDWDKRVEGVQYPDLQNCMIVNHDFYVGEKAFFMDLDPWWNEVPTDIPDDPFLQGIDYRVLVEVLMKTAFEHTLEGERILRIG